MLASMTGFARAEGQMGGQGWTWEVKSVNGRSLELRLRLPPGFDTIEAPSRALAADRLKRGNVSINLTMAPSAAAQGYRVNRALLREIATVAREVEGMIEGAPPRLDGILALRGVIEPIEAVEDEAVTMAREAALLQSLGLALDRLAGARAAEGSKLAIVLAGQLGDMARLAGEAKALAALRPEALRARLKEQVAALLDGGAGLSEERLALELALLATKLDVREELDRLAAHVAQGQELIANGDVAGVGRRLDFLAQEFNREANTLCSKSNDANLTRIGLELKLAIDRFREQAQNIE